MQFITDGDIGTWIVIFNFLDFDCLTINLFIKVVQKKVSKDCNYKVRRSER